MVSDLFIAVRQNYILLNYGMLVRYYFIFIEVRHACKILVRYSSVFSCFKTLIVQIKVSIKLFVNKAFVLMACRILSYVLLQF